MCKKFDKYIKYRKIFADMLDIFIYVDIFTPDE
jgi:hypothetical protein